MNKRQKDFILCKLDATNDYVNEVLLLRGLHGQTSITHEICSIDAATKFPSGVETFQFQLCATRRDNLYQLLRLSNSSSTRIEIIATCMVSVFAVYR